DDYRDITKLLKEKKQDFYIMVPRDERPIKVVIKDLPIFTDTETIKTELEELRFVVNRVTQLKQIRTKKPLPMFLIELTRSPNAEKIYNLTHFMNLKIRIENFQKRPGYTQCWNCQHFHHSSATCQGASRCLKCGENHRTNECHIKERMETPKCINCNQLGHVASWMGCEKFPKPKPPATNRQPPTTFSHRPTDNRTYAETLTNRQHPNPSTTIDFPALQQMAPLLQQSNSDTEDLSISELLNILKALNELRVALKQSPGMLAMLRNIQRCKTGPEMFESLLKDTVNPPDK
ncbi:hypothetical protein AVEN_189915-1, partial [Araneus ventricosus]